MCFRHLIFSSTVDTFLRIIRPKLNSSDNVVLSFYAHDPQGEDSEGRVQTARGLKVFASREAGKMVSRQRTGSEWRWGLRNDRDDPKVEQEQPGEKEKIQEVSDQFNRLQTMSFNDHMHALRGTHLKTQGVSLLRGFE